MHTKSFPLLCAYVCGCWSDFLKNYVTLPYIRTPLRGGVVHTPVGADVRECSSLGIGEAVGIQLMAGCTDAYGLRRMLKAKRSLTIRIVAA